ncbi:MAG: hypothetical protein ABSF25_03385 [Bryobacteraceae bacterium]|jgi:uncharacterized protein (TIGR03437 family)
MDAARTPLSHRVSILLTAALLAAVPAFAAGSLNVNGGTSANVSLDSANTSYAVAVTSTGAPITFTASIAYDTGVSGPTGWLSAIAPGTTPATIYVNLASAPSPAFGSGPFSATVTLTGGGSTATVAVTFSPGSGSGPGGPGGPVSVSPSPLGLSLSAAGSVQGTMTVQSSSAAAIGFTVSTSSNILGWSLSVNPSAGSVSAGNPVLLTVTASTAVSASTTYIGAVTVIPSGLPSIPVSVTLTVNGSGGDLTLTNGPATSSSLSLNATYNTGDAVPSTIASLPVQSASGQLIYQVVSVAYESGANWLKIAGFNGTTPTNYPMSTPLALATGIGVIGLADGVYQATVNLGEPPSAGGVAPVIATVAVTLYKNTFVPPVAASPAHWTFSVLLNGAPQSQTFTITTTLGTTLGTVTSDSSWIHVGTVAANGTLNVIADPTGLAVATYSGNVLVPNSASGSPLPIPIVMVVSSTAVGTGNQVVAPSSLSLAYQIGGPAVSPPTVIVPGPANQSVFATVDQTWMVLDPAAAALPASILIHISPAGLAAQTAPYSGNITLTTQNGVAVIPVQLLVTTKPVVMANPGSLTFTQTGSGIAAQSVDFSASDSSALSITPSVLDAPWAQFSMTPNPFTHGQTLTVSVDATGMSTGTYSGSIQAIAGELANSPVTYPLVLEINGGGNGQSGSLTLSSSALTFNAVLGGAPSTQVLTVDSNTGATAFTATSQMSTGAGWLSISPSGNLATEQNITVTANPASLAVGTYSGAILLTANGVIQQVQVSLVVSSGVTTGGNVQVVPASLSLAYQLGGTAPSAKLQVSNVLSGSAQIPYTVSALNAAWLTVTPASAQTASTVTVGVNTSGLAVGTYSGTVQITPTGGQVVDVPVQLTVTAPSIAVATTSLTFTYHMGDPKPAPQTVQVTGGPNANFTAQPFVTSCACPPGTGPVFSVTPVSGIANPATLTVSVNPMGLWAGSYQGGILVTGVSGTTGSATISVTLNVVAPFPTIAGLASAASGYSGSVSPGEMISIYGTYLGPGYPALTQLDSSGKFVATTLGGVQVLVDGYAAPVTYASSAQVNAVVPYEVRSLQSVSVWLTYMGQESNSITLPLTATAPGIFTLNASSSGQGLILNNADYSVNGPAKPAAPGSWVIVYVTGEGQTLPNGTTGLVTVAQATQPYTPAPLLTVVPRVDGQVAYFNFAGEAPGFVSGVMQVNVQIPANARSGDLPITVSVGGNISQSGVTVRVQ